MKFKEKVLKDTGKIIVFSTIFAYYLTAPKIVDAENKIDRAVLFQPPPEELQPEDTEGAASRQNKVCSQDIASSKNRSPINLTAIVPSSNYGLTLAERPSFWVYIPATSANKAILTLKEKGNNPHWQQSIDLKEKPGIIGIQLSAKAPVLEIDREYQWAIILVCGNKPHPNDPVITAKIKRVDSQDFFNERQLVNKTSLERASIYAQKGIWYDVLDILVSEKFSITNWNSIWIQYLKSAGIEAMGDREIIGHLNN